MSGRLYTAVFKAIAVTALQDLFEIKSPSDAVTVIHSWTLTQTTEVGDAQEEMLLLTTNRGVGAVTSGSGGASVTPQPIADGDPAYGGAVERNNTTQVAVGSGSLETDLEVYGWNIRVPFVKVYTPEERPVISPGNTWTLELETAPADSVTISGTITFEEIGG
jgi:hypothetical protein